MEEFAACFADVIDPRQDNARHKMPRRLPAMRGFLANPSLEGGLPLLELSWPNRRRNAATSTRSAAFSEPRRNFPHAAPRSRHAAYQSLEQALRSGR
jgi:hypothetical protein